MTRNRLALFSLALANFGIGLAQYVLSGLLPQIAESLHIPVAKAGHLISAYALGVVIGAPVLILLSRVLKPKRTLLTLMILFTAFNALSGLSANYGFLIIGRFLAGLPHGAFVGLAALVASRLVPEGAAAGAVATVFAGQTIANIVGVPLADTIGNEFGWRNSFFAIGGVGLVSVLALALAIPSRTLLGDRPLREEFSIVRSRDVWAAIGIAAIGFAGFSAWFSFLGSSLKDAAGFHESSIPWLMALAGVGMTAGNSLGGRLADRVGALRAVVLLTLSFAAALTIAGFFTKAPSVTVFFIPLLAGNALALGPALQILIMDAAKKAELMGAAVAQSAFNVANAIGAFLAGLPLAGGYGYPAIFWVAAGLCLAGSLIAVSLLRIAPLKLART